VNRQEGSFRNPGGDCYTMYIILGRYLDAFSYYNHENNYDFFTYPTPTTTSPTLLPPSLSLSYAPILRTRLSCIRVLRRVRRAGRVYPSIVICMALLAAPHLLNRREHLPLIDNETGVGNRKWRLCFAVEDTGVAGIQIRLRQGRVCRGTNRISRLVANELEDIRADVPAA